MLTILHWLRPAWLRRRVAKQLMAAADCLRDSGDWTGARSYYGRVVELVPLDDAAWVQYGHALKESGDGQAALAAYQQALTLTPNLADTHVQLGHVLKQLGQPAGAVAAYKRALQLDPSRQDATRELAMLGHDPAFGPIRRFVERLEARSGGRAGAGNRVVFEITDLVDYFVANDRPSGIQRVQIELIRAVLGDEGESPAFVCFRNQFGDWVEIGAGLLMLMSLSLLEGEPALPTGIDAVRRFVLSHNMISPSFRFARGDALVPLGATWGHPRHLSCVADLKKRFPVSYLPLLYDLSPIFAAQYCPSDRRESFERWLIGALDLADSWICASSSTADSLSLAARRFGSRQPRSRVVRLDGALTAARRADDGDKHVLASLNLADADYVLLVSTIEPRKNHVAAFDAWRSFLDGFPLAEPPPKLVCAGKLGWMFDGVLRSLECTPSLAGHIVMIHSADDATLDALYRNCVCTLYPSRYEGWGLPITESLCHGKVPVCSNATSLPEAGQEFAIYFDPEQEGALHAALSQLLFDVPFRESREALIRTSFQPRTWSVIKNEIVEIAQFRPEHHPA